MDHGSKINALVSDNLTVRRDSSVEGEGESSHTTSGSVFVSGRLFVADMTSDITVYELSHSMQML